VVIKIISNRLFGRPAVTAHPCFVGITFGAMAMAGLAPYALLSATGGFLLSSRQP
jgi:hypothetical protein